MEHKAERYTLYNGDCLEYMATMPDSSVDLIATDPPYYKVKGDWWDRQWATADGFLAWVGDVMAEFWRILKPNGSLYVFASPRMAWSVEGVVRERFAVLNNIRWAKPEFSTKAEMFRKENLRSLFPSSETIIFAEHYFEPMRAYLISERQRAGLSRTDIRNAYAETFGNKGAGITGHYWDRSQWMLPTKEMYEWLRRTMSTLNHGGEYLRREYEDLRRPFNATPDAPYTDVWTFPTVQAYKGKHPTEKPLALMEHIIKLSSRPDAVVFDPFMGSGTTGVAAITHGRQFIGCDATPKWYERAKQRIHEATLPELQPALIESSGRA